MDQSEQIRRLREALQELVDVTEDVCDGHFGDDIDEAYEQARAVLDETEADED